MSSDTPARTAASVLADAARAMMRLGRRDLAAELAGRAVAEDAHSADCHCALGGALDELGRHAEALVHWRRAAALAPRHAQMQLNLALALLRMGAWREGLACYEARIDKPGWSGFATAESRAATRGKLLRPGAPVAGRSILVLAEQGLGDCVMFARTLPRLAARGARVTVACAPVLRPVFAQIAGVAAILSPPPDRPLQKLNLVQAQCDAWVPLLSLPLYLDAALEDAAAGVPYLAADPARTADWRARFRDAGRAGAAKIGLVFQSNPESGNAADRSIGIDALRPLLEAEAIDVVNLQHGPAGRALAAAAPGLIDPGETGGLDDYMAAMAATDALITVDTMAAHLAGALGHPAHVALGVNAAWIWGTDSATTLWYPSLRLVRQTAPGDWTSVIAALVQAARGSG